MSKTPKSKAKVSTAKPRDADGMVAWENLSEKEKLRFQSALLADSARATRLAVATRSAPGFDLVLASLLAAYTEPSQERSDPENRQRSIPSEILSRLWFLLRFGEWHKIRWLADYGMQHSPEGIAPNSRRGNKKYPTAMELATSLPENGTELAEEMLKAFVKLTGCDEHLLLFGGYLPGETEASCLPLHEVARLYLTGEPMRTLPAHLLPSHLPTKGYLGKIAVAAWGRTHTKGEPYNPGFVSRTMTELGFSGLVRQTRNRPTKQRSKLRDEFEENVPD